MFIRFIQNFLVRLEMESVINPELSADWIIEKTWNKFSIWLSPVYLSPSMTILDIKYFQVGFQDIVPTFGYNH